MAKAETAVQEPVGLFEQGELRVPEMQRRYVWRSARVRDLLDSLHRGCSSGAILLGETDEVVGLQMNLALRHADAKDWRSNPSIALDHVGTIANWQITNKPPEEYFPALIQQGGEKALTAQCIPTAADLLGLDAYKAFLSERRRWVSRRLNEFLGTGPTP